MSNSDETTAPATTSRLGNVDFSHASNIVPDNTYAAELVKWSEGTSLAGNAKVKLQFRITDEEYAGRMLFMDVSVTEKSMWKVMDVLVGLGVDPESLSSAANVNLAELLDGVVGGPCLLEIGHHEYDGRTFQDVNRVKLYQEQAATFGG